MAHGALTRGEVRKALKKLRALGVKPPRVGYCVTVVGDNHGPRGRTVDYYSRRNKVELCRHPVSRHIPGDTGYQIIADRTNHGLFGTSIARVQKKWQVRGRRTDGKKLAFPVMAFDIFEAGRTAAKRAKGGRIEDIVLIDHAGRRR
jgi:hypothetical protein